MVLICGCGARGFPMWPLDFHLDSERQLRVRIHGCLAHPSFELDIDLSIPDPRRDQRIFTPQSNLASYFHVVIYSAASLWLYTLPLNFAPRLASVFCPFPKVRLLRQTDMQLFAGWREYPGIHDLEFIMGQLYNVCHAI